MATQKTPRVKRTAGGTVGPITWLVDGNWRTLETQRFFAEGENEEMEQPENEVAFFPQVWKLRVDCWLGSYFGQFTWLGVCGLG